MKLKIENAALLAGLKLVSGTVAKNTNIPILANVLLKSEEVGLSLRATDLDLEFETTIAAEVETAGSITVPCHLLRNISEKLPKDGTVILELADDFLIVKCGRSRFKLPTLPTTEFPKMSESDSSNHKFELTTVDVEALFDDTKFAISTEETRYYLNGVFLQAISPKGQTPGILRGVATDGHRLAQVDCALPDGAEGFNSDANIETGGVIVPRRTIREVLRLADGREKMNVQVSRTRITFATDTSTITSKLIDGTFPDYARVIPVGNDKVVRVDRLALLDVVERVASISTQNGRVIKLAVENRNMIVSIHNPDQGDGQDELEIDYDGAPIDIGFNSRYFADILSQVKADTIYLRMADAATPIIVQGVGDTQKLFVQMPMRLSH